MDKPDNGQSHDAQILIEELTVNEDQAAQVKGGPIEGTWAVFWKGDR